MEISDEQRSDFLRQLKEIQDRLNSIKLSQAPSGQVAGASTSIPSNLNAAQLGGASGIGFESEENQNTIAEQVNATLDAGGSKSQTGDRLSSRQAQSLVGRYGLDGITDASAFAGLTVGEAAAKAKAERDKRTGQVSANTSFAFNPDTISRTQRAIDKFNFGLDEIGNDPFDHKDLKTNKQKNAINIAAKELGQSFTNVDELYAAYNTNQQVRSSLDQYINKGGSLEEVAKNVGIPVVNEAPQTTAEYLANITNPKANQQAQEQALDELFPEQQIAQAEIARQVGMSEDLQRLYFGDEKRIGILEMREQQAIEETRILEEREKDAARTVKEKARLEIAKNKAQVKQKQAQVEKNRLAAKNYMTGMLAKLGALKTTGAAPLAIQTLETQYQQQIDTLQSTYDFANQQIEIALDQDLSDIENNTDSAILKIQEDLTKGTEDVAKEILKAQQSAEKEIYKIKEQYARRLRERTTKYTTELEKAAEAYTKKYAKTASAGIDLFSLSADVTGRLNRASDKSAIKTTYSTVKDDIKKNMGADAASRIITQLTDEQMVVFLEDYLNERVSRQASIPPIPFYEEWKARNNVSTSEDKSSSSSDDEDDEFEEWD